MLKKFFGRGFAVISRKIMRRKMVWVLVGQELVGEILEKGLEAKCTGPGAARGTR